MLSVQSMLKSVTQLQYLSGCQAVSSYVMWSRCLWRHLVAGCFSAALFGTAPQSMRRDSSSASYLLTLASVAVHVKKPKCCLVSYLKNVILCKSWLLVVLLNAVVVKTLSLSAVFYPPKL
ncbi:hypothetical protein XENORESO_005079 [Xenotaenia resolanae]|uniref:Uncharacterized protein n=1 Tax=Xenotaenia resolanae TaxID=208358 RepID=A0ABV0WPE0_9TELE